jgi:flagellar biosynthesis/type III secretory pathway protein FliH
VALILHSLYESRGEEKMTNKEAAFILSDKCHEYTVEELRTAFDLAIKALEQSEEDKDGYRQGYESGYAQGYIDGSSGADYDERELI